MRDEHRTQEYLHLISQFLYCGEGNKLQLLRDNQELLDHGFIETMVAVEQQLENPGE
jgi:hypothetical protein